MSSGDQHDHDHEGYDNDGDDNVADNDEEDMSSEPNKGTFFIKPIPKFFSIWFKKVGGPMWISVGSI